MRFRSTRHVIPALCVALVLPLALSAARARTTVENRTVPSFDGTPISYTFFSVGDGRRHPVVLMTHGWGGSRTTDPKDGTVAMLLKARYDVLTWDSRGFGTSGGDVNVDSQEFEARDVSALLSFAAKRPEPCGSSTATKHWMLYWRPRNKPTREFAAKWRRTSPGFTKSWPTSSSIT